MPPPVEVKGPQAEEAQRLMAPAQAAQLSVHTFTVDNTDGKYAPHFSKGTLQMEWPGLSRDDARTALAAYLGTIKNPALAYSTPTSRSVQHGLEEALPPLAGAARLNPLIAGPARAAAYLATRGTQAALAPEEYRAQTEGQWGSVLGEAGMQGLEGAAGAWLANPASRAMGMASRKLLTGQAAGHTMTPDEARILGQGEPMTPTTVGPGGFLTPGSPGTPPGPFAAGAALTGQAAYPRLSQFYHNWFTNFSDTVAMALGAKGRTMGMIQRLGENLNAYSTQLAQYLTRATDPRDLARALNQMADMSGREVNQWQHGLWQAADSRALTESGGHLPLIQTTEDLNRLRGTSSIGGQRLPVMAKLQEAVQRELEAAPIAESFREREFARTREQVAPGEVHRTHGSTLTQATARTSRITESAGESTTLSEPAYSSTEGLQSTTSQQQQLPLGGRLHTYDPTTGTHQEHITLGDAMQLRSALGSVVGQSSDIGLQAAEIRVARAWYADLTQRIDQSLEALHPDVRAMYVQARDATHMMYARMRADTVLKTLDSIHNSPEALNTYFFQNGGLARMDSLREALSLVNRVPGTQLDGQRWFDLNITPRLRYQAMWDASETAVQEGMSRPLDNLARATSSRPDIQQLIQNKQLVSLRPGAFTSMEQTMGKERFDTLMGGEAVANRFRDLDTALQYNQSQRDVYGHIYIAMLQTGGASRAANAVGTLILGATGVGAGAGANYLAGEPLTNFIAGVGGGGTLVVSPMLINYLATSPKNFETLIMGIRRGEPGILTRLASQLGVHAARKAVQDALLSGEPPPPLQIRWPLTPTPGSSGSVQPSLRPLQQNLSQPVQPAQ